MSRPFAFLAKLPLAAYALGFGLFYVAGAELGHFLSLSLTDSAKSFATFWPPSGIYLAALALSAPRRWPIFIAFALAGNFISDTWLHDKSILVSLAFGVGNTLEALCGAWLLRKAGALPLDLSRLRGVFTLLIGTALLGPALSATVGAATSLLALGARDFAAIWLLWWSSAVLGIVLVAPIIFCAVCKPPPAPAFLERWGLLECVLLMVGLTVVARLAFLSSAFFAISPLCLSLLFLLWAALRLGTCGTTAAVLVLSLLALFHTSRGLGPFADPAVPPYQQALVLQVFLGVAALGSLVLAAAFHERQRAEESRREAEHHYRALLDSSFQGILVHQDGVIRFANPAAARMFGFAQPDDLLGLDPAALEAPEAREEMQRSAQAVLRGEAVPVLPASRGSRRDGSTLYVQSAISRTLWGGSPAVLAVHLDVTARHYADEARCKLEAERAALLDRMQMILDRMPTGCILCDANFRITYWNPAAETIFGYRFEEVGGRLPFEIIAAPNAPADVEEIFEQLAGGRLSVDGIAENVRRDGQLIHCEWHHTALRSREGGFVGVLSIFQDVTDRRRSEEEVRRSREMLRAVLDNIPVSVFWKDTDCRFLGCNSSAARVVGLDSPEEIVGKTDFDLHSSVEEAELFQDWDRRVMETDTPAFHILKELRLPDGSMAWLDTTKVPLHDNDGKVFGLVGVFEDVTERKTRDQQILASLREKEALLKEVHHRVKNNLQIISSLLSLQAGRIEDPATLAVLLESRNRVRSMALIHESLYRSGDLARIDMARHVSELCAQLFRSYGVDTARIQLETDVGQTLLDLDQAIPCGLVINELVSNALKYAFPNGRPGRLTVRLHEGNGRVYSLQVVDNGVGLPSDRETRRPNSLGLQLVRDLTQQLDGTLAVQQDGGTAFTIIFPG